MLHHPEAQKKLREEILRVVGKKLVLVFAIIGERCENCTVENKQHCMINLNHPHRRLCQKIIYQS